jgi:hypothetical protein
MPLGVVYLLKASLRWYLILHPEASGETPDPKWDWMSVALDITYLLGPCLACSSGRRDMWSNLVVGNGELHDDLSYVEQLSRLRGW